MADVGVHRMLAADGTSISIERVHDDGVAMRVGPFTVLLSPSDALRLSDLLGGAFDEEDD